MANRDRVSMEGRHSKNVDGGVGQINRIVHAILEQNESLHVKVDELSYKLDSLVEQFRRYVPADNDHPKIIVTQGHTETNGSIASNPICPESDTTDMDQLAIGDEADGSRSRPSSFGSSDSSFAHISVRMNIDDDINGVDDTVTNTNGVSDANAASHSNGVIKDDVVDKDRSLATNYRELNDNTPPRQDMRILPKTRNGTLFAGIKRKSNETSKTDSPGSKTGAFDQSKDTCKDSRTHSFETTTVMKDKDDGKQSPIDDTKVQSFEQEVVKQHSEGQQLVSQKQRQQQSQSQGREAGPEQHPNESRANQPGFMTSRPDLDNDNIVDKDGITEDDIRLEDTEDEGDGIKTMYAASRSTKRPYSANFGETLPHPRSSSPMPVARHKIRTPYSYFKRRRTVIFDDNRPKYFDKVLDIESFSGAEDIVDVEQTDVKELSRGFEGDSKPDMQIQTRNNALMPESGLQNEHGPADNRFDKEAHLDVGHHAHHHVLENITFICPRRDGSEFKNGPRGSPNRQEGDEIRQGCSRNMKPDTEIRVLIDREKQSALECSDPKSMHGIDTVICLDTSASMKGEALKTSKKFILDFLAGLDESATNYNLEENVALVTFGRQNKVLQHLTNKYDLIRKSLKSVRCEGPSPLWLGVALCLTELSSRGGACSMDSLKVLPRIIIISDFFSSMKNRISGPDIQLSETKGNSEVCGIIEKNRTSVSSFDFVLAGSKTNQELLEKIGGDRVFTMADVLYLAQFFRVQDVLNRYMTKQMYEDVGEDYLNGLMKERGLTKQSQRDLKQIANEDTPLDDAVMDTGTAPGPTETEQEDVVDDVVEPEFGTRIKASEDWVGYHTRLNMSGRVIASRKKGLLKVLWEDGTQERLKYGVSGEYNVIVDDTEPDIDDVNIKVGSVVERGPDWQWGKQDGGPGNIGVVTNYDTAKKVVMVLWEHGCPGNYRYGYKNKYDVALRPMVQRLSESNQKRTFWQMQVENNSWIMLPSEVIEKIEKHYLSNERNTFLVNIQDTPYRISLTASTARNTATNSNHAIKRLELTRAEWLHMTDETST